MVVISINRSYLITQCVTHVVQAEFIVPQGAFDLFRSVFGIHNETGRCFDLRFEFNRRTVVSEEAKIEIVQ